MTLARTSRRRYGDALTAALFVVAGTALALHRIGWVPVVACVALAVLVAAVRSLWDVLLCRAMTRRDPAAWPWWVTRSVPDRPSVLRRVHIEYPPTHERVAPVALTRVVCAPSPVTGLVDDSPESLTSGPGDRR